MLIINETPGYGNDLSPEEIQQLMQRYSAWADGIRAQDRYVIGEKLGEDGGKIVSRQSGRLAVVDGPYSEAKEVIGGYMTIRAKDYDEVLELLKDCPLLERGRMFLRQTDPMGCGGE
jgi:hypothetical protein